LPAQDIRVLLYVPLLEQQVGLKQGLLAMVVQLLSYCRHPLPLLDHLQHGLRLPAQWWLRLLLSLVPAPRPTMDAGSPD